MKTFQRYFLDIITKNFINFDGKAGRKEYWMFFLLCLPINILVTVTDKLIFGDALLFRGLYILIIFLPDLGLSVRRLHDIGKHWTWVLITIIPIIGPLYFTILMATEGIKDDTEFGPDPKTQYAIQS